MPKVGQEPVRRAALVSATIEEIGRAGSLEVTVGQIAKSAGMSTALAHYYYDSKSALFLAAMQQILREFGSSVRQHLTGATTPRARLAAIVAASLGPDQFSEHVVSAWLVFYVESQRNAHAARLLNIYARRLHSNLVDSLRPLVGATDAHKIASGAAAMIDGIYIRSALQPTRQHGEVMVGDYLDQMISACQGQLNPAGKMQ